METNVQVLFPVCLGLFGGLAYIELLIRPPVIVPRGGERGCSRAAPAQALPKLQPYPELVERILGFSNGLALNADLIV